MSDSNKSLFRTFFSLMSDFEEFVDNHEEELDTIVGKAEDLSVGLTNGSEFTEDAIGRRVTGDHVVLTVDMGSCEEERVNVSQEFGEKRNAIDITVNGSTDTMAILPKDAIPGEMEWKVNNGILTVEVPRGDNDA